MNIATAKLRRSRTSTSHIELRLAKVGDEQQIADLLEQFFDLSGWRRCLRFYNAKCVTYLAGCMTTGSAVYVVAFDGDELVGLCSYHVWDVCTDPIAVMDETFVVPRLRRTDLGRRLVYLALHLAKGDGCAVMHFPICSGMPAQNSLMNMVGRHFGAEPVGMIFRKVL